MKIVLQEFESVTVQGNEGSETEIKIKEKEYKIPFVPAGAFLEYLEIEEEIENLDLLKPNEMKRLVALIVKTFQNQFTEDEFFQGVPGYLLMRTINEFISALNTDPYANKKQKAGDTDEGNAEKKAG